MGNITTVDGDIATRSIKWMVETSPLVFCYGIIYVHQPPAKHFLFCRVSKVGHENGRKPWKKRDSMQQKWDEHGCTMTNWTINLVCQHDISKLVEPTRRTAGVGSHGMTWF